MNSSKIFAMTLVVMAAGLGTTLAPAYAQYDGSTSTNEQTLKRCDELKIPRTQCTENVVLQAERMLIKGEGSGMPWLATETGQLIVFVGTIGAVFGSVSAAFFLKGRRNTKEITT